MKKLNLESLNPCRENTIVSSDVNKFYIHIEKIQVLSTFDKSRLFEFFNIQNIDINTGVKFTNAAGKRIFGIN